MNKVKNVELEGVSSREPAGNAGGLPCALCQSSGQPSFFLRGSCVEIRGWVRKCEKQYREYGLCPLSPTLFGRVRAVLASLCFYVVEGSIHAFGSTSMATRPFIHV